MVRKYTNRRNKFEIIRKEMSKNISLVNPFSFHPQSFNELMNYRPLHLAQRHSESFILRLKRALASRACLKKNRVAALFFFETVRRKCGLSLTNKPNITSFDFPKTCALAVTGPCNSRKGRCLFMVPCQYPRNLSSSPNSVHTPMKHG